MQVKFTTEALEELRRILDVYVEFSGPMSALKFGKLVDSQISKLSKYPAIGHPEPLLSGYNYLFRSKSVTKYYRIIYLVHEDTLWIFDFWDSRRDPQKLRERVKIPPK